METKDLIVVGGGINGVGIAADASGRGLSVLLLESEDLACATSSASSKLIHGGLRYLENYKFRLVRESLKEREILLKMAPHIIFPMKFQLPHKSYLRPRWIIRIGLFIYDHLSNRTTLPSSRSIKFNSDSILKPDIIYGFEYYDCWVDDSRLVVLNAQEVISHGGEIKTRTKVTKAWRENGLWKVQGQDMLTNKNYNWTAKGLVNATGPWVKSFISNVLNFPLKHSIRLIKGSHIVVPKLHNQSHAYILQNEDNRIVFVIPWMNSFSIIGTTDIEYYNKPQKTHIENDEIDYLIRVYNNYFKKPITQKDIVWTYSGIRPLYDDKSNSPQKITRDYTILLDDENNKAPLLSIFGGKITTYRKLAEHALKKLSPYYPKAKGCWTHNLILKGGDFKGKIDEYTYFLLDKFSFLPKELAYRYSRTYGTCSEKILENKYCLNDLGKNFGCNLYEAELTYLVKKEWAITVEDVIWRRTKLGMWLKEIEIKTISEWLSKNINILNRNN